MDHFPPQISKLLLNESAEPEALQYQIVSIHRFQTKDAPYLLSMGRQSVKINRGRVVLSEAMAFGTKQCETISCVNRLSSNRQENIVGLKKW